MEVKDSKIENIDEKRKLLKKKRMKLEALIIINMIITMVGLYSVIQGNGAEGIKYYICLFFVMPMIFEIVIVPLLFIYYGFILIKCWKVRKIKWITFNRILGSVFVVIILIFSLGYISTDDGWDSIWIKEKYENKEKYYLVDNWFNCVFECTESVYNLVEEDKHYIITYSRNEIFKGTYKIDTIKKSDSIQNTGDGS